MYKIPGTWKAAYELFTTEEWNKRGSHRLDEHHLLMKMTSVYIRLVKDQLVVATWARVTVFSAPRINPACKDEYEPTNGTTYGTEDQCTPNRTDSPPNK